MSFPSPTVGRLTVLGLLSLALLWGFIRFPGHPSDLTPGAIARWPIELPILAAIMVLPPARWRIVTTTLIALGLGSLVALRLGDLGSLAAFGRTFNPVADAHLFAQGWTLASQSVGRLEAASIALAAFVLLTLSVATLALMWLRFARSLHGRVGPVRIAAALALLLGMGVALNATQQHTGVPLGVRADLIDDWRDRTMRVRRSIADQLAFQTELDVDPLDAAPPSTFEVLQGRDVIVLFVESYGRSFLDHERFRARADDSLATLHEVLGASGLHVRSGWADSPIRGGRSWLAQATVQSGLMLSNQARFDRLLASDRRPLATVFEAAGYASAAVLPVVEGAWYEGSWYDVDRFIDGPALGFRGKRLGYVPMPDQYVLHAFERDVRSQATTPLFATIGLLGSHAPWTPLVTPVPWDDLGDGSIFDGSHRSGSRLDWARPGPVRDAYARSLELTLDTIGGYLQRYADDALIVVVGDHQPASVIAGWAPNAHVPVHIVARDPALLDRLPATHFQPGTRPDDGLPPIPLADIRTLLARAFESSPACDRQAGAAANTSSAQPDS